MTKRFKDEVKKIITEFLEALSREKYSQGECLINEKDIKNGLKNLIEDDKLHSDLIVIPYKNQFGLSKIWTWGMYDTRGNWPKSVREVFNKGMPEVAKFFTEEGKALYKTESSVKAKLHRTLFQAQQYENVRKFKEEELKENRTILYIKMKLSKK